MASLKGKILRAYEMIAERTPIRADCGKLCNAACCRGEEDAGMLLFPGEMLIMSCVENFRIYRMRYMEGRAWLLTCPGQCDRQYRPLSCRIFPLAPCIDNQGNLTVQPDPRARRICPLWNSEYIDRSFYRAVEKALLFLAEEPRIYDFMRRLSEELEDYRKLC